MALTKEQKRVIANGDFDRAMETIPPTLPEPTDHEQNKDQYIDKGGVNEVTAAQLKAAVVGGTSGYSGYSGYSGQDGASGYSGQDGVSGYSGLDNSLPAPPVGDGDYKLHIASGVATWVSV